MQPKVLHRLVHNLLRRYLCEHWRAHGPPHPSPCSSAPSESSLGQWPPTPSRRRCSGTRAAGRTLWRWAWSWSWPLCRRKRSQPRICRKGREKPRGGTRSPKESRLAGRRCGPGRWQRSAQWWRSWSPATQSRPTLGLSSHHLDEAKGNCWWTEWTLKNFWSGLFLNLSQRQDMVSLQHFCPDSAWNVI